MKTKIEKKSLRSCPIGMTGRKRSDMKRKEVELTLAAKAYLIIQGVEYEKVSGSKEEGFCFVPVRHDGWKILKYEQLINGNYTIRIKSDY